MKFIAAVQQASQSQRCVTLNANQQNRFWCVRYLVFVSFSRYMDVVFILQLCNSLLHMLDARFSVCYEGKNAVCFVLLLVMQSILIYSQLVLRSDLNWYTYNFDSVKKIRQHTHLDDLSLYTEYCRLVAIARRIYQRWSVETVLLCGKNIHADFFAVATFIKLIVTRHSQEQL